MSLLSYTELVHLVDQGIIENCPHENINGASIDITLAREIKVEQWNDYGYTVVDFKKREPLSMSPRTISAEHGFLLGPAEFILAASEQIFHLPANIAMELKLKSSAARVGLEHLGAGWADPTWHHSALTLELVNCTKWHAICLRPGDRIAQVVFFRCEPVPDGASYRRKGRYNNDPVVTEIKP